MSKITIIKLVKENASVCSTKIDGGKNWNFQLPNGIPVKVSKKRYNAIYGEVKWKQKM